MGVTHLCDNTSVFSKNKHIHQGNWLWSVRHDMEGFHITIKSTRTHTHTMTGQIQVTLAFEGFNLGWSSSVDRRLFGGLIELTYECVYTYK